MQVREEQVSGCIRGLCGGAAQKVGVCSCVRVADRAGGRPPASRPHATAKLVRAAVLPTAPRSTAGLEHWQITGRGSSQPRSRRGRARGIQDVCLKSQLPSSGTHGIAAQLSSPTTVDTPCISGDSDENCRTPAPLASLVLNNDYQSNPQPTRAVGGPPGEQTGRGSPLSSASRKK